MAAGLHLDNGAGGPCDLQPRLFTGADNGAEGPSRFRSRRCPSRSPGKCFGPAWGTPAPIEDHLLEVSEQNSFFIESVISVYQDLAAEKTEIDLDDLPSSPEGAVNALLDHRRTPQRALATALATVQVFDRKLYEHLAYVLSVELGILHYRDFVESFIVEALDERLSRTHDLLTKAVRLSPEDASIREVALEAATNHLLARCEENGRREHQAVLGILRGIIEGWGSVEAAPDHSIETLIDAGYILHDAGFSNELQSIVASAPAASQPSIAAASTFFEALASRRTAGVDAAIERFERVKSRGMRLGRHRHSVDLELAYLRELGGNYFQAREEFKQLAEETEPFNPTDRAQLRARLYYADILIMDGDFREGSRVCRKPRCCRLPRNSQLGRVGPPPGPCLSLLLPARGRGEPVSAGVAQNPGGARDDGETAHEPCGGLLLVRTR